MIMNNNKNGGYVFISHSHKDIEKVREIRNGMESEGFEPLCFYLKCLSEDDEIEDLIKREIDAREWFVFIESENSLSSAWVTKEREYISTRPGKQIVKINLAEENSMENVAKRLVRMLRTYILFSGDDADFAEMLRKRLMDKDYQVLSSSYEITSEINREMCLVENQTTMHKAGCILAVMSRESVENYYFREELYTALTSDVPVVAVFLDGYSPEGIELNADEGRIPLDKIQETASTDSNPEDWALTRIIMELELIVNFDIRTALERATSHNEVMQYEWRFHNDPEIVRLCEKAHDRIDSM